MAEPMPDPSQSFFERWQHEFRQSRHPLAPALHGFVALDDLRQRSDAVDYLYSHSTFALIDEAKGISNAKTLGAGASGARGVVRLRDVAAAFILRVHKVGKSRRKPSGHAVEKAVEAILGRMAPTAALSELSAHTVEDPTAVSGEPAESWVLDPDLVDTCALAAYLAGRSTGAEVPAVDLDGFIIALLVNPVGRTLVFETFLDPGTSTPPSASELLWPIVGERFSDDPVWDEILRTIDAAEPAPAGHGEPDTRVPDYIADRPIERLRDDVLDFKGDARAVAEIVCQREPGPPLAIGLFGDWGSGKSSFMNLLRQEIDQLTAQARAHDGASPFITRADHVVFNAWQYNDVQLWPVLAETTFSQLRAGGAKGTGRQLSDEVLKELTKQVDAWQDTADGLALDLMQTQRQETVKRDELMNTANERDASIRRAREAALGKIASHLAKSAGGAHPGPDAAETATEIIDAAEAAPQSTAPTLRDVFHAVRLAWTAGQRRWLVVLGIAAALVIAIVAWFAAEVLLGLILPLVAGVAWYLREVQPLVAAIGTYRVKQAQAERAFRAAERDAALELAHLDREMRQKQNEIRRQLSRAAQFKGRSPAQVLQFFLSEGAAVKALQEEVGIVSRVRRAFEQLNAVVKNHETTNDTPQRIVFYIDDLDRCRAEQVVRVLEAVHLLLAFDRFVVVVGVDTRWLETSLMSFYDEQLRANRTAVTSGAGVAMDSRATVRDYVEKIFQVPIQIPRLTTGEEGTYARLVDVLCPVAATGGTRDDGGIGTNVERYRQLAPIQPLDLAMPEPERFREAVQRARLTADEVGLLRQLGVIAGRSPRAVKRLVNLYRLLRATRTGARFTAFLEGDSATANWPDYPAVQLCLAVEVGLTTEQIHRFRQAVLTAAAVPAATPGQVFDWPPQPGDPWAAVMGAFLDALSPTQRPEDVHAALRTVVHLFGNTPDRLRILRDIVVETWRFSFSHLTAHPWGSADGNATGRAGAPSQIGRTSKPRKSRRLTPTTGS